MSSEDILADLAALDAAWENLASRSFDALTPSELLEVLVRLEVQRRRHPAVEHRVIAALTGQASAVALGGKSWRAVLSARLHIGGGESARRLAEADDLGPRTALSGHTLPPRLAHLATAQQRGQVGAEHVALVRDFTHHLPQTIDAPTRDAAEATLVTIATEHPPAFVRKCADRLTALLHPDGDHDERERARRRHLTIGGQQSDGMSPITGLLDPEARATVEAVFAKWAAPGMCNPDDDTPCVDGTPSEAAIQADTRSSAQRHHDALIAMGRSVLASGALGQHNGLPASIIVSTTLQDLESAAGQALTAGGSLLPMRDVIRLARHAHHYLTVFDRHTGLPLYLARSRRTASPAQRIVLYARDRGCTRPGCTVPAYGCEAHHAHQDWATGGQTNINELGLACPGDNRLVQPDGYHTRINSTGRVEWIPPPHLDTGQPRVNEYHHPENLLMPDDEEG